MTFGEQLRRKRGEVSLRQIAHSARISPAYLSDIELGRRLPSEAVTLRLARALGMNESALLTWVIDQRVADMHAKVDKLRATTRGRKERK